MFYFTTIIVFPALIALFVIVELQPQGKLKVICENFHFLELYIGKGIYLLMLAMMLLEKTNAVEIIFGIALLVISVINIVVGFLTINEKPGEEDQNDEEMQLTGDDAY